MDQCSNIVKRNQWASIISACQSRPKGVSKREWLDHNGIPFKTYYYWFRKFQKEALTKVKDFKPAISESNGSYAEITIPQMEPCDFTTSADIVIKAGSFTVAISNSALPNLVSLVLEGLRNAH